MDGVHDLGGRDGFGPVEVETDEPVFHHAWERRVFGLAALASRQQIRNMHAFRHAIERMDPVHYLSSPYYERWLTALATLLVERGVISRAELEARAGGNFPLSRAVGAGTLGVPAAGEAPRFGVSSPVRVRNLHPRGHTRCPGYVRGRRGVVVRVDPPFPLPDVRAHSNQRHAEHTYCVRFSAAELWGAAGSGAECVHVDLWESYLEGP